MILTGWHGFGEQIDEWFSPGDFALCNDMVHLATRSSLIWVALVQWGSDSLCLPSKFRLDAMGDTPDLDFPATFRTTSAPLEATLLSHA